MKSFEELPLHVSILKALQRLHFTVPTPIQALSLPASLEGRDVQGEASTGTGKTLAFLLPILEAARKEQYFQALILVPTRELVTQVGDVIDSFRKAGLALDWAALSGGTSIVPQLRRLRRPMHVYVGTPGRVQDHLTRGTLILDELRIFVLDEADRMLDMGFAPQIKRIQASFPEKKAQTLFFSATYPNGVNKLMSSLLQDPVKVRAVSEDIVKPDIDQDAFFMDPKEKFKTLVSQLSKREGSVLVFAKTKYGTEKLALRLSKTEVEGGSENFQVGRTHGGLNQGQRNRTLREFRSEKTRILVATDVAARGLDVEHVNHVINYDVPQQAEDYLHRIGRTGRAGRKGAAISFVTHDDRDTWKEICSIVRKQLSVELPSFFPKEKASDGQRNGHRNSQRKKTAARGGGRRDTRGAQKGARTSTSGTSGKRRRSK